MEFLWNIMEKEKTATSKEKIMKAAQSVFKEKGKAGARIDEIAEIAGVNKAMIYYHFKSKDEIYTEILKSFLFEGRDNFAQILKNSLTLEEKIKGIVDLYFDIYSRNTDPIKIMFREILDGGKDLAAVLHEMKRNMEFFNPDYLCTLFEKEIKNGKIREIDGKHLIMSIHGMCVFYFFAKPVMDIMISPDEKTEYEFLKVRKEQIVDLILNGIKVKR